MNKKDGRRNNGGARLGAGRKKEKAGVYLSLPIELAAQVNALPDKNQVAERLFAKYLIRQRINRLEGDINKLQSE